MAKQKCLNYENCNNEFEPKRTTAKFCSPKCRVDYARANNIEPSTGEIIVETKGVTAKISPNLLVEDPRGRTKELVELS